MPLPKKWTIKSSEKQNGTSNIARFHSLGSGASKDKAYIIGGMNKKELKLATERPLSAPDITFGRMYEQDFLWHHSDVEYNTMQKYK